MCAVFSLLTDAVHASFDHSYHLLTLKNKGGLVIPSEGAVKVASQRQGELSKCFWSVSLSGLRLVQRMCFFLGGHNQERKSLELTTAILCWCHWLCLSHTEAAPHCQTEHSSVTEWQHRKGCAKQFFSKGDFFSSGLHTHKCTVVVQI